MNDQIKLSTGRILYANCGILGISPDLKPSEGYDGEILAGDAGYPGDVMRECSNTVPLTHEERRELASIAIDRWARYADLERSEE